MSSLYESLRESLLKLGARNPLLRTALRAQARASGFKVAASTDQLTLSKGSRRMLLPVSHYPVLPSVVHMWDQVFDTVSDGTQSLQTNLSR